MERSRVALLVSIEQNPDANELELLEDEGAAKLVCALGGAACLFSGELLVTVS